VHPRREGARLSDKELDDGISKGVPPREEKEKTTKEVEEMKGPKQV